MVVDARYLGREARTEATRPSHRPLELGVVGDDDGRVTAALGGGGKWIHIGRWHRAVKNKVMPAGQKTRLTPSRRPPTLARRRAGSLAPIRVRSESGERKKNRSGWVG